MDLDRVSKYCNIGTFFLTAGLFVLTAILVWPYVRPGPAQSPSADQGGIAMLAMSLLVLTGLLVLVAAILNFLAHKSPKPVPNSTAIVEGIDPETHKKLADKLTTCESTVKHWKDEVRRMDVSRTSEKETLEKLWKESEGKANTVEQKLQVAQNKLDEFRTPRYRLKIKRAEYTLLGKVGLDVTEVLDRMILDDKLVLDVPYNDIFRPDPWKHSRKHLIIDFSHGLKEFSVTVPENTKLVLPFPYDEVPFPG